MTNGYKLKNKGKYKKKKMNYFSRKYVSEPKNKFKEESMKL